jgi:hypothetical protein
VEDRQEAASVTIFTIGYRERCTKPERRNLGRAIVSTPTGADAPPLQVINVFLDRVTDHGPTEPALIRAPNPLEDERCCVCSASGLSGCTRVQRRRAFYAGRVSAGSSRSDSVTVVEGEAGRRT